MSKNKNQSKPARRSGEAVAAMGRNSAGPMRHRLQPRGGARNDQADLFDDYEDFDEMY